MPELENPAPFEIRRIVDGELVQVWRPKRRSKADWIFANANSEDGIFEFWIDGVLHSSSQKDV